MNSTKLFVIVWYSISLCFISIQIWSIKDVVLKHQNIINSTNSSLSIGGQSVKLNSNDNYNLIIGLQIRSVPHNTQKKVLELHDVNSTNSKPKMTLWMSKNEFDLTYIADGNDVEHFIVSVPYSLNERIPLLLIKNSTTTTFEVKGQSQSKSLSETIGDLQLRKCDSRSMWCVNTDVYKFSLL